MGGRLKKAALAAFVVGSVPAVAADATSPYCMPGENGAAATLDFDIRPSLVVTDATLDVTFGSAFPQGGEGAPGERLFSFSRTIGSILRSAGAPDDQTSREDFVRTMISSFDNDAGVTINHRSAVFVPVDDRLAQNGDIGSGEGKLVPARLLDEHDAEFGMKPLALFNRFDLATRDWEHCGEYRIVYSIPNGGFQQRFLLIFEAMVPNPGFIKDNPVASEAGCRPMLEFWAGLGKIAGTDESAVAVERARQLAELYYTGKPGITDIAGTQGLDPIVSYANYGGNGNRGQVRGNVFIDNPWQLREWLTQLVVGPAGPTLAFVPETVKDNPVVELYGDDIAATPIGQANIPAVIGSLHADFVTHFATEVQNHLLVERSPRFQALVEAATNQIDAGVTEDDLLITLVALGSDGRFDDFQSVSDDTAGTVDKPTRSAGQRFRRMLDFLLARPEIVRPGALPSPQSTDILLARAEAGTCSGCHQTAARNGFAFAPLRIKAKPDGSAVLWPDLVAGTPGFVHVMEDRRLSVALEKHFLPVRRLMMGTSLCRSLPQPDLSAAAAFYVEDIIGEERQEKGMSAFSAMAAPEIVPALAEFEKATQLSVVDEIMKRLSHERALEREQPGAFVEVRRAH